MDRMTGAGKHHRGSPELDGRIVHVIGHDLVGTLDGQHAIVQDPVQVGWTGHSRSLEGRRCRTPAAS